MNYLKNKLVDMIILDCKKNNIMSFMELKNIGIKDILEKMFY